jgi:2-dehydropantoate 2-reductase
MRWKYSKLLGNIGNTIDAACGRGARTSELLARARIEALNCYAAARIDYASDEEVEHRRVSLSALQQAGGLDAPGGSSWQSLARNADGIESDWLNGEIVFLGRRHGVPTPVNDLFRQLGNRLLRERIPPGSIPLELLQAEVDN